ncbi:hypothetical protein QYF36_008734 [Acer negundo]|nr:hypothetical protein QYF36_008734 [Acer negundo]
MEEVFPVENRVQVDMGKKGDIDPIEIDISMNKEGWDLNGKEVDGMKHHGAIARVELISESRGDAEIDGSDIGNSRLV